jgi:hypothetical protein
VCHFLAMPPKGDVAAQYYNKFASRIEYFNTTSPPGDIAAKEKYILKASPYWDAFLFLQISNGNILIFFPKTNFCNYFCRISIAF